MEDNSILVLLDPLKDFFNKAQIIIYHNNVPINLIDSFPLVKEGYAMKCTLVNLIIIYCNINKLKKSLTSVMADNLMIEALNDVYTKIKLLDADFNPSSFPINSIYDIIRYGTNTIKYDNPQDVYSENLASDELRKIITRLISVKSSITLKEIFINNSGYNSGFLNSCLFVNDWIMLIFCIITNNITIIKNILKRLDPRIYNNEAYHTAIEENSKDIIKLIKDNIVKRNWIEQQVFESIIGDGNNLPFILQNYSLQFI